MPNIRLDRFCIYVNRSPAHTRSCLYCLSWYVNRSRQPHIPVHVCTVFHVCICCSHRNKKKIKKNVLARYGLLIQNYTATALFYYMSPKPRRLSSPPNRQILTINLTVHNYYVFDHLSFTWQSCLSSWPLTHPIINQLYTSHYTHCDHLAKIAQ